jgi:hypothetical protein
MARKKKKKMLVYQRVHVALKWFHLASQPGDPTGRIRCTPPGIKAWLKPCGWARWESTPFRKAPKLMWKPLETHGTPRNSSTFWEFVWAPLKKIAKIGGRIVLCQSISSISHGKIIFMVLFLLVPCEIWGQYHTFTVFFCLWKSVSNLEGFDLC